MEYLFKFKKRRCFFWNSVKIIGHRYDKNQDKMILYIKNGSVEEIAEWSKCSIRLGVDWVIAVKSNMENTSGHTVKIHQEG